MNPTLGPPRLTFLKNLVAMLAHSHQSKGEGRWNPGWSKRGRRQAKGAHLSAGALVHRHDRRRGRHVSALSRSGIKPFVFWKAWTSLKGNAGSPGPDTFCLSGEAPPGARCVEVPEYLI